MKGEINKNYTVSDVAKRLNVSQRTILREIKRGKIKPHKVGRRYLISDKALLLYLTSGSQDLNQKIDEFIDNKKGKMITLLQRLVSIPSESRKSEFKNMAKYLSHRLRKLGIRIVVYGKGESTTIRGSFGYANDGILLDCPLDTAPVGDRNKWKFPPFDGVIRDRKMYGRGTLDCKSGMVAMIYAVLALKKYVNEKDVRVELVFDGGEHSGAYEGMRDTLRRGLKVKAGIIGYGGSGSNIAIGSRGYHRYKITSYGHSVHTGARYKAGVNAITNMAALIIDMEHVRFPKAKDKYFNFGSKLSFSKINGGKAINIIPDECEAYLDVRTTPDVNRKEVEKILKNVIKSASHRYKGFDVRKEYLLGQEGYKVKEDEEVIKALSKAVIMVKGRKPGLIVHGPAHIGTLLAKHKIPVVVWGPDGGGLHSYNEYVEIDSIPITSKIYASTILKFFGINGRD